MQVVVGIVQNVTTRWAVTSLTSALLQQEPAAAAAAVVVVVLLLGIFAATLAPQ